ncbi:MAG: HEAT repeat domain-containing protein [Planctomycetes bacterium]|nr:HEAT repeat domain-containing protein [Planctomycetota bacterium]MBL7041593.1 HEAT repeat domain-containing protein [Pirellulaceae bacterium]
MSGNSDKTPPEGPTRPSAEDSAHPAETPNVGCLMKLVVIPMGIVAIFAGIWLVFGLLAHMGNNPRELIEDLKKEKDITWQKALTLANMLRDSQYQDLKRDPKTATDVASVLQSQIESGAMDAKAVKLRVFLSRALGEFEVPDVVPALIQAARVERDAVEVDVRRSALEAITVLATNIGPEELRKNERLMDVVLAAAAEQGEGPVDKNRRDELRLTAAFTLGVIGGDRSIERLELLLDDPYPNARYNAATGLARHGKVVAIPVLVEMLDPDNPFCVEMEKSDEAKQWKRDLVVTNAIRAVRQLAEKKPTADLSQLKAALEKVIGSDLKPGVRTEARETLHALKSLPAK